MIRTGTSPLHVHAGRATVLRRLLRVAAVALLVTLLSPWTAQDASADGVEADGDTFTVNIYYFWGDGCPVCAQQRAFLDWLVERYPEVEVHAFEVWSDPRNRPRLQALSDAFGRRVQAVPVTFIGEDSWIGFNQVAELQMTASVEAYRTYDAPDSLDRLPSEGRSLFAVPPAP
jgi:thiol-disulfide isomerase/thioredoxin